MEMTEMLAAAVDNIAAETNEKLGAKMVTSSAEAYHPLFAGSPESFSRVALADTKTPSMLSTALYKAVCDVAIAAAQLVGPSGFSSLGNSDFLNDLCSIANYERELTGTDGDNSLRKPEVLRTGSTRAIRLQAVFDHLTETFVRFVVPVASTPGLPIDGMFCLDSAGLVKIRRAAREAAVMVLRHLSGADRVGSVSPVVALGTSRDLQGSRASSGNMSEDLVRQTVMAIQNAASQVGPDIGVF